MTEQELRIPDYHCAVQLVGPGQLVLNRKKETPRPGPYQVLAAVEAVCICYSDTKLLRQFAAHPRKGEVMRGIGREVLEHYPAYVPGERPTVPGHEVACRIVAVGSAVTRFTTGERCLVMPDYRALPTAGSTSALGHNFEGGLQEYMLFDERIVVEPGTGERLLIPVPQSLSAAAVALVEPWSCVENSYSSQERRTLKPEGNLLVVAEPGHEVRGLAEIIAAGGRPASITALCADESQRRALETVGVRSMECDDPRRLGDEQFDDVVYFGADRQAIEALNDRVGLHGIVNVVLGGRSIGRPVSLGIGRVHYAGTRWIGTVGKSAFDSYQSIPATGELRRGDTVLVVGAGGPMGQMHVIRSLCAGIPGVSVVGTDIDDARLQSLRAKAGGIPQRRGVPLRLANATELGPHERFSYQTIMVPDGTLVAGAVRSSAARGLINVFAGIPAKTRQEVDLDTYIAHQCFMFGTSGSVIGDMKVVLSNVEKQALDTNLSIEAVSGMAGAIEAIAAAEHRAVAGKIVVYPMLHDLGLVPLARLAERLPAVAAKLCDGQWCRDAEDELLLAAAGQTVPGERP